MTDAKIATLYENYQQYGSVKYLPEKVENMRKRAVLLGAGTSFAIFFANEVSRFSMRSPIFRLRPIPILLVALVPTAFFKYGANEYIEKEVTKFWNIHKFREENGLGGSYLPSGLYKNQIQDKVYVDTFAKEVTFEEAILGKIYNFVPASQIVRTPKDCAEFPNFHEDVDRDNLGIEVKQFQRARLFDPDKKDYQMKWFVQSPVDKDTIPNWGGIDNDNPYHEPPDKGFGPTIDHKQDERDIWSFSKTGFNQQIVQNLWNVNSFEVATREGYARWSKKLRCTEWATPQNLKESLEQRAQRQELEILQAKLSVLPNTPQAQKLKQAAVSNFIQKAYDDKLLRNLEGVNITDHKPSSKRLHTNSESEDQDFFNYEQKLREFHKNSPKLVARERTEWEHPFIKAQPKSQRAEDGSIVVEVTDDDLDLSTESLKERYNFYKEASEVVSEPAEESDDELPPLHERVAEDETGYYDDFNKYKDFLSKVENSKLEKIVDTLGPFEEGEEYSLIKDLQDAYRRANSQNLIDVLLERIPDHAFWDIKTPLHRAPDVKVNTYNPMRSKTSISFWEHRSNSEWLENKERHANVKDSISSWVRY